MSFLVVFTHFLHTFWLLFCYFSPFFSIFTYFSFFLPSLLPSLLALNSQFSIVGVLPVAYADTVLHRLLRQMAHHAGYFGFGRIPLFLLLPSTAYNKATAQAGTLAYNKLAVMSRGFCKLTQIASYNVNNFSPLPKCESMVLCSVEPLEVPRINAGRLDAFEFIARQLFARRTVPLEQTIQYGKMGGGAEGRVGWKGRKEGVE